jgi:hypothetical protein
MPLANHAVVAACRAVLTGSGPIEVAEEYSYASLPLCVIDSVFSIGVRYEGVRAARLDSDRGGELPSPTIEQPCWEARGAKIRMLLQL